LQSTRLRVQDSALNGSRAQEQTSISRYRRLEDLNSILITVESWLAVFSEMTLADWVGITVDSFAQFTHLLVVLFKLTILDEPGWDLQEVRRRVYLFEIIDRSCEMLQSLPSELGMTDAEGPRRGLFFKTTGLLMTIKNLFLAEMPSNMLTSPNSYDATSDYSSAGDSGGDYSIPDDFVFNIADEPWLSDIFDYSYALGPENSYIPSAS
jgi:hypothetical protein